MSSTAFVNGSTLSDAGWANDVDTYVYSRLTSVSGTNTIVGTGPVSMTTYAVGQIFSFIPANTNTGATTLNITPSGASALGAKNVFCNGAACVGNEIRQNVPCEVFYDGTQFNLMDGFPYLVSSFTATLTGCTTAPTGTVKYSKIGNIVTMDVPAFTATSNTTAKSLTGAPAAVQPAAQKIFVGVGRDNGGAYSAIEIVLETTGVINFYFNFENAWTGSGGFGVRQFSVSYTLA